ncbi:MAG: hypothetical protein WD226_01050 [Planctomycetota bacterium]
MTARCVPRVLALFVLVLASCGGARATSSLRVVSRYVDRGVVQVDNPVVQASLGASVTDELDNRWSLQAWGNVNLTENSGHGDFADDQQGEVTQLDLTGSWGRSLGRTELLLTATRIEFEDAPRRAGSTTELSAYWSFPVCPLTPILGLTLDVDEIDDYYLSLETSHPIAVEERWRVDLFGRVGYFGDEYARVYTGEPTGGVADFVFGPQFEWRLSPSTRFVADLLLHRSSEEAYRDRLRERGLTPDNLVLTGGVVVRL